MNKELSIKQQNKRDRFADKNSEALSDYHFQEIAIGILDDDLPDHYNEWIGTQSLEDLQDTIKTLK